MSMLTGNNLDDTTILDLEAAAPVQFCPAVKSSLIKYFFFGDNSGSLDIMLK